MKADVVRHGWKWLLLIPLLALSLALVGCDGDDGDDGPRGEQGPPGSALVDASTASDTTLEGLDIESEITDVRTAGQPEVDFRVQTADGRPVIGLEKLWEADNRFVRYTLTKLVPGTNGDPDSWVAYTRDTTGDGSTGPDYDSGSSLVGHGDGTYTFTFNTDVNAVSGVPYEPSLTHRVAGQIGSGDVALEAQNPVLDFVPAGGDVTNTRNIAVVQSCNECHDELVFHGRRFKVEYCVNCHNPDLAEGEGNFSFMVHRIHDSGTFTVLDEGVDYSEVTYPQNLENCRKCHNSEDADTQDADNWKNQPNIAACSGCHEEVNFATGEGHVGGPQPDNSACTGCHPAASIEEAHLTANATPNNPTLLPGQRNIQYELVDVTVDEATGQPTVDFRITSDGEPLDLTALPADLAGPDRYPGFLMAWSLAQGEDLAPVDPVDPPAEGGTITAAVASSTDDAEELDTGVVQTGSTDLEMSQGNTGASIVVGLRFPNVAIPNGATITEAFVQFTAADIDTVPSDSDPTTLTIFGEAADDAIAFAAVNNDVTGRAQTTARVDWSPAVWIQGESGADQQTADISSIIQEIVDRGAWAENNALALIIEGTGGRRSAFAIDGGAAPVLHVTYTMEPTEPGEMADSLAPADFNNLATPATAAEPGSQPISVDLGTLVDGSAGSMTCSGGICTAILNDAFPAGAAHRTIGLQGYFQQDIAGETVSLHTTSVTMATSEEDARREVVDSAKCAACHEFFEGHGGNRNIGFDGGVQICTMCHNPNLSSSGRSIDPANAASRPDPVTGVPTGVPSSATEDLGTSVTSTWPEDTNNLKDMIHGIHSSALRTFDYEFVRGRNDGIYYNWSEVTFPAENGTRNCLLCHLEDTYELPLSDDVLPTTVRTTQDVDGLDADHTAAGTARANVPNPEDWVNSPTASTCYYCHDSTVALNHMEQNGGVISIADPDAGLFTQRQDLDTIESCDICHGPGKQADLKEVHGIE